MKQWWGHSVTINVDDTAVVLQRKGHGHVMPYGGWGRDCDLFVLRTGLETKQEVDHQITETATDFQTFVVSGISGGQDVARAAIVHKGPECNAQTGSGITSGQWRHAQVVIGTKDGVLGPIQLQWAQTNLEEQTKRNE